MSKIICFKDYNLSCITFKTSHHDLRWEKKEFDFFKLYWSAIYRLALWVFREFFILFVGDEEKIEGWGQTVWNALRYLFIWDLLASRRIGRRCLGCNTVSSQCRNKRTPSKLITGKLGDAACLHRKSSKCRGLSLYRIVPTWTRVPCNFMHVHRHRHTCPLASFLRYNIERNSSPPPIPRILYY